MNKFFISKSKRRGFFNKVKGMERHKYGGFFSKFKNSPSRSNGWIPNYSQPEKIEVQDNSCLFDEKLPFLRIKLSNEDPRYNAICDYWWYAPVTVITIVLQLFAACYLSEDVNTMGTKISALLGFLGLIAASIWCGMYIKIRD